MCWDDSALCWQRWETVGVVASAIATVAVVVIALMPIIGEWYGLRDRRHALRLQVHGLLAEIMKDLNSFQPVEDLTIRQTLRDLNGLLSEIYILTKDERTKVIQAIELSRTALREIGSGDTIESKAKEDLAFRACDDARAALSRRSGGAFHYASQGARRRPQTKP